MTSPGSSHHTDPAPPAKPSEPCGWVVDTAPEQIAVATREGALLYLNVAGRSVLGLAPETELTGLTLAHLQPAWAWHVVQQLGLPTALETGSWGGETAAHAPGGTGEIAVAQRLITLGSGDETRVASIMRDLSDLKRREVERLETMNRYETAIRLSGQVLLDWEPFSGQLSCSGDLHGLLGREPSELTAGFRTLRSFVHPDDLSIFDEEIQRTVASHLSLCVNFRIRHRDGEYRHVRAAGGFYLNREGRFGRITAMLLNIDFLRHAREEVQRLEAQLGMGVDEQVRQAREETERAKQAKSEFLSRMSHELRTPLNAILGFTQLLELESPTASQKESIEHIARAGQHLLSLINEVLDFSRLESGRLPLNLAPVSVGAMVREVLELIRPVAEPDDISLIVTERRASPEDLVIADAQRLKQVLSNLFSNAVKFNRKGGLVTIRFAPSGTDRLRISVTDTGPGISSERLSRLFTPLTRTPPSEAHLRGGSGTGLGLALARAFVEAMHGELGVESVPGEGSTFWVELPLAVQNEEPAPEFPAGPLPGPLEQRTILFIEDEELNRELVRRVLTDYPEYDLITAAEGEGALELAKKHLPSLILLDLNLPDVPGETVLARLKDDPEVDNIPVVMVTADVLGHRLERLLQAGAAAYLTKPFKISELVRVIRDTLAARMQGE